MVIRKRRLTFLTVDSITVLKFVYRQIYPLTACTGGGEGMVRKAAPITLPATFTTWILSKW